MTQEEKPTISLTPLTFAIFNALKEHWCCLHDKDAKLHINEVEKIAQRKLKEIGHYLIRQSLNNAMMDLERLALVIRMPRLRLQSPGIFQLNWKTLEDYEVVEYCGKGKYFRKKLDDKDELKASAIQEDVVANPTQPEIQNPQLLITNDDEFSLPISESCNLGIEEFRGSALDSVLRVMFFDGSFLEVVVKDKKVTIIPRNGMDDCEFDGEPMKIDKEYPVTPFVKHLLTINANDYGMKVSEMLCK